MQNGTYIYLLNNKPTGITEKFYIEILPDGKQLTVSTRDASVYGTIFTVKAIEKNNKFQAFEINFKKESEINAIYKFADKTFHFERTINGEMVDNETFELPKNCVIFPLMRCFQGKTILQVAKNQAITTVLVPNIINPNDTKNLLKPTFDQRTAENIGQEAIAFYQAHSVTFETNIYRYFTKHYDENSRFWIDKNGLLVAYQFQQTHDKLWNIHLQT
jgi:hypothetical protein